MKELIKKWWFWLIILIIVLVVGFVIIMGMAFNTIKGEAFELAQDVQKIYPSATVYSSVGGNTIIMEFPNWNNDNNEGILSEIHDCIQTRQNNGELQGFKKLITLSNIDNLFIKTIVNLENFTSEQQESYILFEEYLDLFDKYEDTMEVYKDLFNSIY